MSAIMDNALDSLRMGVAHLLDDRLATADKWAILELFHTIELLLKERLFREHPLFVYRDINKVITEDGPTVGLQETLIRFQNLNLEMPEEYRKILLDLQKRRNRIEHHRFDADRSHRHVLGEALKFVNWFLEEHLGEQLTNVLAPELYHEARELIFSYDELLRTARAALEAVMNQYDPKDRLFLEIEECPSCGNDTLLIGHGDEPMCYYCERTVEVWRCGFCGRYKSPDSFAADTLCEECYEYKLKYD